MAVKRKSIPDVLHQHWVHSHEEDTETEMVFRPATYNFPRSRGRRSFELRPDGSLIETGIGPTDRPQENQGTWKLEAADHLILCIQSPSKPDRVMKIASVHKDKLVIQK